MARRRVNGPAAVWLAGGVASCARAAAHHAHIRAAIQATWRSPRICLLLPFVAGLLPFLVPEIALFVPQRFDRLNTRSLACRHVTEKKSSGAGHHKCNNYTQA